MSPSPASPWPWWAGVGPPLPTGPGWPGVGTRPHCREACAGEDRDSADLSPGCKWVTALLPQPPQPPGQTLAAGCAWGRPSSSEAPHPADGPFPKSLPPPTCPRSPSAPVPLPAQLCPRVLQLLGGQAGPSCPQQLNDTPMPVTKHSVQTALTACPAATAQHGNDSPFRTTPPHPRRALNQRGSPCPAPPPPWQPRAMSLHTSRKLPGTSWVCRVEAGLRYPSTLPMLGRQP